MDALLWAGATLAPIHLVNAAALFLSVLPTTLARLLLRSQAERKAASASHSDEMKGEASPHHSTPRPPLRD